MVIDIEENEYDELLQEAAIEGDDIEAISLYTNIIDSLCNVVEKQPKINSSNSIEEEAKEQKKKRNQLKKTLVISYSARGLIYADIKEYNNAINDFNKAIELFPYFSEAYFRRGTFYVKLGKYDNAIDDYSKAIELDPSFGDAYYGRGAAYFCLDMKETDPTKKAEYERLNEADTAKYREWRIKND